MTKRSLLVLGMGHSQVDLIQAAREMDLAVYGCAGSSSGPGVALVDDFEKIDVTDWRGVARYASARGVSALFSMGLEVALPAIAKASEFLGLRTFFSSDLLARIGTKGQWRALLGDLSGNVPFLLGKKGADFDGWNQFPAVLKPVDGSGQRGVARVDCREELEAHLPRALDASKSGVALLEAFAPGSEISVNCFVQDGKLAFFLMSDRLIHEGLPGGIVREHRLPSRFDDGGLVTERVRALVQGVIDRVGFTRGHLYFQIKISEGVPRLIEFTPRFDGCHMWKLIRSFCGLDLRKVALEVLLDGESKELGKFSMPRDAAPCRLVFISQKPGENAVCDNSPFEGVAIPHWYYAPGEPVKKVTGYLEKTGFVILPGIGKD